MGPMASQITSVSSVYSTVFSDADKRKHQSSVSLDFVRVIHWWLVNSPHKGPIMRKMFLFYDVIMKLTIIGSDNGFSSCQCQAVIWTNAGILLIWRLGTNFNEMLIKTPTFSFKKMHLKMLSAKWRPFCLSLNVLMKNMGFCHWTIVPNIPVLLPECISCNLWIDWYHKLTKMS